MIQWLSDWLKEIILIILLAAFVDLLLPNSSMQRYVKVVISLFILLTILSPIVTLLKSESDLEIMMANDTSFQVTDYQLKTINEAKVQSLQDIKGAGEKLNSLHNEQSLQFIESQMEEMIQNQLVEELPDHTVTVAVETHINEGELNPEVQRIQVHLASSKEQLTGSKFTKTSVPVEPVSIQIHVGEDIKEIENSFNKRDNQEIIEIERIRKQVYQIITENWNLTSDKIYFIYDT